MSTPNSTTQTGKIRSTTPRPTYTREEGESLAAAYRHVPAAGYLALDPNSEQGKLPLRGNPDTVVPGRFHSATKAHVTVDEIPAYVEAGYGLGIVAGHDKARDQFLVLIDADNWLDCLAFESWYKLRDPQSNTPTVSMRTPGTSGSATHSGGGHYYIAIDATDVPQLKSAKFDELYVSDHEALGKQLRLGWGAKFKSSYACMPPTQRIVDGEWRTYHYTTDRNGELVVTKAYPGFIHDLLKYKGEKLDGPVTDLGPISEPDNGPLITVDINDPSIARAADEMLDGNLNPATDMNTYEQAATLIAEIVEYNRQVARWQHVAPTTRLYQQDMWYCSLTDDEVAKYEAALRAYAPTLMDDIMRELPLPEQLVPAAVTPNSTTAAAAPTETDNDDNADMFDMLLSRASGTTAGTGPDSISKWENSDDETASYDYLFAQLGNYTRVGKDAACGCARYKRVDSTAEHSCVAHDKTTCDSDNAANQVVMFSTYQDRRYRHLAPRATGTHGEDQSGNLLLSKFDLLSMAMNGYKAAGRWVDSWCDAVNFANLPGFKGAGSNDQVVKTTTPATVPTTPAVGNAAAPVPPTPPAVTAVSSPPVPPAVAGDEAAAPTTMPAATTTAAPATPTVAPVPPTPPAAAATTPALDLAPPLVERHETAQAVATDDTKESTQDKTAGIDYFGEQLAQYSDLVTVARTADGKRVLVSLYADSEHAESLDRQQAQHCLGLIEFYRERTGLEPNEQLVFDVARNIATHKITGAGIGRRSPFDPKIIADICNASPLTRAVATRAVKRTITVNPVAALFALLHKIACRIHPAVLTPVGPDEQDYGTPINMYLMLIGESGSGKTNTMKSGWLWKNHKYGFDHNCYFDYSLANRGNPVRATKPDENKAHLHSLLPVERSADESVAETKKNPHKTMTQVPAIDPMVQPQPYPRMNVEGVLPMKAPYAWDPDREGAIGSGEVLSDTLSELVDVEHKDEDGNVKTEKVWQLRERPVFTVKVDEFETFLQKGNSSGATLVSEMNTAWSGGSVGNITVGRGNRTAAGRYRMCRIVGAQPALFQQIERMGKTGALQRELMVAVQYPWGSADVGFEQYEGELRYPVDVLTTPDNPTGAISGFTMDPVVYRQAFEERVGDPRGAEDPKAFAHRNLQLIHIACLLTAAHGLTHITMPLWKLARQLIDYSTRCYYYMRDEGAAEQLRQADKEAELNEYKRAATAVARDTGIAKAAEKILEVVHDAGSGGAARRDFTQKLSGSAYAHYLNDALALLTSTSNGPAEVVEVPPPPGKRACRYVAAQS